ncbi:MAG TPA: HU family DNA-binding protein [Ferrovibrio sp.]|jgi:DNA-binding protein HU-beta|uniref:HU family DNA-binding protein n=1 Tax=Ferrovibrio sp. TaxID=1917215 RepID=UPI002B4B323D|nr:HU family DNA-binding protein [Ferrovibrio sp.]HLT77434.1 HU family DNA-binding protein [Ferrovibrio sp.]
MNKADLVEIVRENAGCTKAAAGTAVDAIFDAMAKAMKKEGGFTIVGFGTFKVTRRAARKGRNPQTGETIKIPASKSVRFKASSQLKERL